MYFIKNKSFIYYSIELKQKKAFKIGRNVSLIGIFLSVKKLYCQNTPVFQ